MSALLTAIFGFFQILFSVLVEIPLAWMGELTLFLITLGHHKPRWDFFAQSGGESVFRSEASLWLGLVIFCAIGGAIKMLFFAV